MDSKSLLGPRGELEIHHNGETYRLRITGTGKLVLNKRTQKGSETFPTPETR